MVRISCAALLGPSIHPTIGGSLPSRLVSMYLGRRRRRQQLLHPQASRGELGNVDRLLVLSSTRIYIYIHTCVLCSSAAWTYTEIGQSLSLTHIQAGNSASTSRVRRSTGEARLLPHSLSSVGRLFRLPGLACPRCVYMYMYMYMYIHTRIIGTRTKYFAAWNLAPTPNSVSLNANGEKWRREKLDFAFQRFIAFPLSLSYFCYLRIIHWCGKQCLCYVSLPCRCSQKATRNEGRVSRVTRKVLMMTILKVKFSVICKE